MASRRRSRFSTLTNTVSDIQQRLRYVEKRPSYSRLARQAVLRQNIRPRAVATDQLEVLAVTNPIIADDAVTSRTIAPGTIQTGDIGPGQIQNSNIGAGAVDSRALADNAVLSRHIANGEVKNEDLGGGITNDKLAGGITNDKLAGGITIDKLAANSVDSSKIVNGSVSNDDLAGGITNNKLAGGITIDKLAANSVDSSKIVNGSVSNDDLAGGITNNKLAGGITNDKLAGNITEDKLAGNIPGTKLRDGSTPRGKLNFVPVETVNAGDGLAGGGSDRSVTVRVDSTVSRTTHTHSQYAVTNHGHPHTHTVSGNTQPGGTEPNTFHSHFFGASTSQPFSSLRFKKDISHYEFDVSKLLDTNLVKFRYLNQYRDKRSNREWFYGYIAEELEENGFEEILCYDENKRPNAVNYSLIGVLTLELVKLQEQRIADLETKLAKLTGDVE